MRRVNLAKSFTGNAFHASPITPRISRLASCVAFLLLFALSGCLSACTAPGAAARVIKIGVIAPFEGLGRPLGYAVLPAIKGAIADANAGGALGAYRVALVALSDDLDPATAAAQAQVLAADPDVVAILGPFDSAAAQAVVPVLGQAALPLLAVAPITAPPVGARSLCPAPAEIQLLLEPKLRVANTLLANTSVSLSAERAKLGYAKGWRGRLIGGPDLARPWFIALAGAAAEGSQAAMCDLATLEVKTGGGEDAALAQEAALAGAGARILLQALAEAIGEQGQPTRAGVSQALTARPIEPGLAWFQVSDGRWVRSKE